MDIIDWLYRDNTNEIEIFASGSEAAELNADIFQTDDKNIFGSFILNTGGIYVDKVIRVLGSTHDPELRDIGLWNKKYGNDEKIIIGDDIFGGIFAVNIKSASGVVGNIYYYAPDTLEWEDMDVSFKGFIEFLKKADFSDFYGQFSYKEYTDFRNSCIKFNEILCFYPPQWSKEFKTSYNYHVLNIDEYYKSLM